MFTAMRLSQASSPGIKANNNTAFPKGMCITSTWVYACCACFEADNEAGTYLQLTLPSTLALTGDLSSQVSTIYPDNHSK